MTGQFSSYPKGRATFKGTHNRTKTLLLWAISRGATTRADMRQALTGRVSSDGIDACLTRVLHWQYISSKVGGYHLLAKGQRFLALATREGHLARWLGEVKEEGKPPKAPA